jgi:tripartite ATP-independent transporter DctP family solute receptor
MRRFDFPKMIGLVLAFFLCFAPFCNAAPQYTIKFSLHIPPNEEVYSYAATLYFKTMVESKSQGRIEIKIFPSNQLGSERESLEGLQMGTHQMDFTSTGAVPSFAPEVQCLAMPYLFKSRAVAWEVFDGDFGRELVESVTAKTGMRILGISENGIRHFVTTKKQVKSVADLKGLKIRTMENPAHMIMVKALGANPTPIAWGELYTALQQGVVDGYELPLPLIDIVKLYQVSKYVILDGHIYDPLFLWINEKFYQKLPADLKTIIDEAAVETTVVERAKAAYYDNVSAVNNLEKNGMIIYTPTEAEHAEFQKIAQQAVSTFIEEKIGKEWNQKLARAIEDAEKKTGLK